MKFFLLPARLKRRSQPRNIAAPEVLEAVQGCLDLLCLAARLRALEQVLEQVREQCVGVARQKVIRRPDPTGRQTPDADQT